MPRMWQSVKPNNRRKQIVRSMTSLINEVRKGLPRSLDFIEPEQLRLRTGTDLDHAINFAVREMLANGLDVKGSVKIRVSITSDKDFYTVTVTNDGETKLTPKVIDQIFDFDNKASSNRGLMRLSRGRIGNALKCIFGFSYISAELKNLPIPSIIIESGASKFTITLSHDNVRMNSPSIQISKRIDRGTVISVKFPVQNYLDTKEIERTIEATALVNPTKKITYEFMGKETVYENIADGKDPIQETSALWYKLEEFTELFLDYAASCPDLTLKRFITSMFRGFQSHEATYPFLQDPLYKNGADTLLTKVSREGIEKLYANMKALTKPIDDSRTVKSVLGIVGKEAFEKRCEKNGWTLCDNGYSLNIGVAYDCRVSMEEHEDCKDLSHVEYPFALEIAKILRPEDNKGLTAISYALITCQHPNKYS